MVKPRKTKPIIYIFCEGESEIEYAKCLKKLFYDVVAIQNPVKGTFDVAKSKFNSSSKFKDNIEVTDEIWFFIDVDFEQKDQEKWDSRYKTINTLRKLRKKPNITTRLLMTTGCIEYWLYLHFNKTRPSLQTKAEKDNMEKMLLKVIPNYKKGDEGSISQIFKNYKKAVENGKFILSELNIPKFDNKDEKDKWLYKNSTTFTNVHEAIIYLESL